MAGFPITPPSLPNLGSLLKPPSLKPPSVPVVIRPVRGMSGFVADAVIEEHHEDELVLTDHPVEKGSTITDHAYKMPAKLGLVYVWSAGSSQNGGDPTFLKTLYQNLLNLQSNRTLFHVDTGKRAYDNMILQSLAVTTDKSSENILEVRMTCQEILFATTTTTPINQPASAANMLAPNKTAPINPLGTLSLKPAPNFNAAAAAAIG